MATGDIEKAIEEFRAALPGWWFRIGECSVSCDATVGPDRAYCSREVLNKFDNGIDFDLDQPTTMADALRACTEEAFKQLIEFLRPYKDGRYD